MLCNAYDDISYFNVMLKHQRCYTQRPTFLPEPSFSSFSSLSGFFLSPLRPTSRIGILDLGNFDLIHRSSRARYPRSPPSFFRIDSVYISRIFQLKNRHYLGFCAIINICIIQPQDAKAWKSQQTKVTSAHVVMLWVYYCASNGKPQVQGLMLIAFSSQNEIGCIVVMVRIDIYL